MMKIDDLVSTLPAEWPDSLLPLIKDGSLTPEQAFVIAIPAGHKGAQRRSNLFESAAALKDCCVAVRLAMTGLIRVP